MSGIRVALLAGGLLLSGIALGQPATWEYARPPRSEMRVSLDVLVDGAPVRLVAHQGRLYLPVPRMGAEYEIRVNNHGPRRITAIVSVDGLSVIRGDPATEHHPGYLVDPYSNVVVKGWRRDRDTVAAFTFEDREHSYASRMGYPENVGVIGLVAFEEMGPRLLRERLESGPPASAKSARGDVGGTGTGWGRDIDSRVDLVPFVRSSNKRTVTIYYDTPEALRRAGIPVDGPRPVPFPGEPRYAPPPP